jgi:ribosomal protein S18 acetylase RimI-like enzyme
MTAKEIAAIAGRCDFTRSPVISGVGPGRLGRDAVAAFRLPLEIGRERAVGVRLERTREASPMTSSTTDNDLYLRGAATLVASWEEYVRGSAVAALERLSGVSAAVFPNDPERVVYNNALLDRHLGRAERAAAVDAMAAVYGAAGVERYAAWVHESDKGMRAELSGRGYSIEESTRAMGMSLSDVSLPLSDVELEPLSWTEYLEYLRIVGAPAGLLSGADASAFHTLGVRRAGAHVATAIAFDHDGDCGLFNMSTLEAARRRGLGRALTARHVHDAAQRGCSTASLQSTAMAERIYAAVGFRDLGRILEYVPPARSESVERTPHP